MTSRFSARIIIDAGSRNEAIYEAVLADGRYYDGPDHTGVSLDKHVDITVSAARISHLRAGVNSVLRLAHAADGAIESVGYNGVERAP